MWELQFEIESKCSLNCVHCSSLETRASKSREYTDDELIDFLKVFHSPLNIHLTGGDPINYANLSILCNKIQSAVVDSKIGIYSTGNNSNSNPINDTYAIELKNSGVTDFYFSIYSDVEEEHDTWTFTKGSYLNTLHSIISIKNAGLIPKAHVVLTRTNCRKIDTVINFCKNIGIEEVRILRLSYCGAAKNNWDDIGIPLHEQNEIIKSLINNKHKYDINLSFSGYPELHPCRPFGDSKGCQAGLKLLYIDIHGDVYPCACAKGQTRMFHITEHEKAKLYIDSTKDEYRINCLNMQTEF